MSRTQRKSPRIRCRIPCQVQASSGSAEAVVRDVSQGGLSLHGSLEAAEGENLEVSMQLPGGATVEVSGLVWHTHRVRSRDGKTGTLLGVVVSNPPDAFLALSARAGDAQEPKPDPSPPEPTTSTAPDYDAIPTVPEPGRRFQVRVKQDGSPRSRVLSIEADSEGQAKDLALERTGGGWSVTEIVPV